MTVLVNSKYMSFYIDWIFVKKERINTQKYKSLISYYNTNSTQNKDNYRVF